jgi:hypothetical protein
MRERTPGQLADLRTQLDIPSDIRALAHAANWDLHEGPCPETYDECDVVGFGPAIDALREWASDGIPHKMWLDVESDNWLFSAPEWFPDEDGNVCEVMWEDYIEYDHKALICLLFGRELGEYL